MFSALEASLDHWCARSIIGALEAQIAERGLAEACQVRPELKGGNNVMNGSVTCPAVAEAHGMDCVDPSF